MVLDLKVTAPATLEEGYSFDATVDGRVFRITVPEGGVIAGEEFVVHNAQEVVVIENDASIVAGKWRNSIFLALAFSAKEPSGWRSFAP